jgi:hypothetical protein
MKTAMQEMVDFTKQQLSYSNLEAEEIKILRTFLNKSISLLEKEKQQIMDAVKTGMWETEIPNDLQEYGENYYDSTFGDNHEAGI